MKSKKQLGLSVFSKLLLILSSALAIGVSTVYADGPANLPQAGVTEDTIVLLVLGFTFIGIAFFLYKRNSRIDQRNKHSSHPNHDQISHMS